MKTAVVIVSDCKYYEKAMRTIHDVRSVGNWCGDVVFIAIDLKLDEQFKKNYNIIEATFPKIDTTQLLGKVGSGFRDGFPDGRETMKINQWEKLHVFDDYFLQWDRIIFFDAGLRVLDSIDYLLELPCKDCILAPNDAGNINNPDKIFETQISFYNNADVINRLKKEFKEDIFRSQYFLNCIWVYDTAILKVCNKTQLIDAMNAFPCCKSNEMGIMNLLFHFKYNLWKPFPIIASNNKYLFDWSEKNLNLHWTNYCYIKYPVTI